MSTPNINSFRRDSLERVLHEYFQKRAGPLYQSNPWLFYALESALVSLAAGIFVVKGRDVHVEPANHFIALTGVSGQGKGWIFGVFDDLVKGIFPQLPFGSGQGFLEALQKEVNNQRGRFGVARGYTFFDEATLIGRNLNTWAGDLADFMNQLWSGQTLTWKTRSKNKPDIYIPGKSYIVTLFLATTTQRWGTIEAHLGESGWTRRFLVLHIKDIERYIQEEKPDLTFVLELAKTVERIQVALKALRHFILRIGYDGLAEAKTNAKLKELRLSKLRKLSIGEYLLRLMAARLVAQSVEVPNVEEFKNYHDAVAWVRERTRENLENRCIEFEETPSVLQRFFGIDVELSKDLRPFSDYMATAKVVSSGKPPLSPKEAETTALQLTLEDFADPLNVDVTLTLVTASLAEVVEAASEVVASIIEALKDLAAQGKYIISRKEFANLYLKRGRPKEYNYTLKLLWDAGKIRLVTPSGLEVTPDYLNVPNARVKLVTDPEAPICVNCLYFGTDKCPHKDNPNLTGKACGAFKLAEVGERAPLPTDGGEANEIFVPHNL